MSGLAAIVNFSGCPTKESLHEMLKWTRPPFAKGHKIPKEHTHHFQNLAIGSENEILSDPRKNILLIFWGQLYKSKANAIITRYQEVGEACFKELDGEYAFILLDKRTHTLYAVRDRMGIYPLYWYINGQNAYITTTLKAILSTGQVSPTCDLAGIASSLGLGYISQDVTCIQDVNRLLPGYYLKLSLSGPFSIIPYWSYSSHFSKESADLFDSSFDIFCELERQVKASVLRRRSEKGGCLSGHLGSYLIWDTLYEAADEETPNFINAACSPDEFLSSLIPMVWALEMPNANTSAPETWQFVKQCQQHDFTAYFDSGFSAEFYDYSKEAQELYQNYYPSIRPLEPTTKSKLGFYLSPQKHLQKLRRGQEATPILAFLEKQLLLSSIEFSLASKELSPHFDAALFINQFYNLPRIRKLDASLFYLTMKSRVTDSLSETRMRIAQSHAVSCESPFLDYNLLDFFASIAPEVWASPDLIASFPDFWRKNHEAPENIASWPRRPAVPEKLFLSKEVWPWFLGLSRGKLVETGLISPSWVKKALSKPKEHLKALYGLLILEVWMGLFIDLPLKESNKDLALEDLLSKGL